MQFRGFVSVDYTRKFQNGCFVSLFGAISELRKKLRETFVSLNSDEFFISLIINHDCFRKGTVKLYVYSLYI